MATSTKSVISCLATFSSWQILSVQPIGTRKLLTSGGICCRLFASNAHVPDRFLKRDKMMRKFLAKGDRKKKRRWFDVPIFTEESGSSLLAPKKINPSIAKRYNQLSKVLYTNICDLLDSGEVDEYLVEENVKISSVKLLPGGHELHIKWLATGTERDKKIQDRLDSNAAKLRSLLCGLHLISSTPKIKFLKDMDDARTAEITELLKDADMGSDKVELLDTDTKETVVDSIEEMNSDILSLDRSAMINKILVKKMKTTDRDYSDLKTDSEDSKDFNLVVPEEKNEKPLSKRKYRKNTRKLRNYSTLDEGFETDDDDGDDEEHFEDDKESDYIDEK